MPTPASPTARRSILGSIDFYKVGHHGSTNATPIPAVGALNQHVRLHVLDGDGCLRLTRARRPRYRGPR